MAVRLESLSEQYIKLLKENKKLKTSSGYRKHLLLQQQIDDLASRAKAAEILLLQCREIFELVENSKTIDELLYHITRHLEKYDGKLH